MRGYITPMSMESLVAPLEIGVVTSTAIFGVTFLQCCMYYIEHSTNDPVFLKCLVAGLMALETLHEVLIGHLLYFYSVKSFKHPEIQGRAPWSFSGQIIVSVLLSTITQCFFAMRIYYLNGRRRFLPVTIVVIAIFLLVFASSISLMSAIATKPYTSIESVLIVNAGSVRMFVTTTCDMMITISTIYYLRKSRTPLAKTKRVINKLIRYTLNTGLLTMIFALITGIVLLIETDLYTYTPFYFITTRLYACSLISILNSRTSMQKEFIDVTRSTENTHVMLTSVGFDLYSNTYNHPNQTRLN